VRKAIIFCLLAVALATAQPKRQSVAVLPSVGELEQQDLEFLTDKVREIASKTLPQKQFMLLKLDAIVNRVGEEELFRMCKEGVCIGELARKSSADYGARCDVFKRGKDLVLKFELYNVKEEEIVETFTEYKMKDFYAMLDLLDKRLPNAFKKMLDASKGLQGGTGNVETVETAAKNTPAVSQPPVSNTKPLESAGNVSGNILTDSRDGEKYKTVRIGKQTWMAENLNYNATGSKCYDNKPVNCDKYGRLYNWSAAQSACPVGWHLPSDSEWTRLTDFVGSSAGKKLKSTRDWNKNGNGTDEYGFSALPGGNGNSNGYFDNVGTTATGGAPRRTVLPPPGTGTCTTASRSRTGTTAARATCFRFVACRTDAA